MKTNISKMKRQAICGAYAMLCVIWLLSLNQCRTDIQPGIERANDLMYNNQYIAAERLYRKLLQRIERKEDLDETEENQRLLVLDRLGKINALFLHNYSVAIQDYQLLVKHYPATEQAFAAQATVADIYHHKLGNLTAAIDAYQKLVSDFPDKPDIQRAQLEIANAYFQLRNFEQARSEAELVINRWPKSIDAIHARLQIANSYYVQARYAEAIATYERILEANQEKPDDSLVALVLFELGNCFQELDQSDRALAYYYACLKDHPDPTLVQHKIRRVRNRLRRIRPLPAINLPDYLQDRLLSSRRKSTYRSPTSAPASTTSKAITKSSTANSNQSNNTAAAKSRSTATTFIKDRTETPTTDLRIIEDTDSGDGPEPRIDDTLDPIEPATQTNTVTKQATTPAKRPSTSPNTSNQN